MPRPVLPDVLPPLVSYLAGHAELRAALPPSPEDGLAHVSADARPPWPCLRVALTPAGSDGSLLWTAQRELLLEAWGPPAQEAAASVTTLHDVLYLALRIVAELPDQDVNPLDGLVVARVASTTPGTYLPDAGQPRYLAAVLLTVHPATAA